MNNISDQIEFLEEKVASFGASNTGNPKYYNEERLLYVVKLNSLRKDV